MPKRRWLPDNVTAFKDKMGRTRFRFRKKGLPQYLFRNEPGTPEFMDEYQRAKMAAPLESKPAYDPKSFHALIDSYYRSLKFTRMKPSSQKMRQNSMERWRAKHGDKLVTDLHARHIDKMMADMADRPHAANDLRKMLSMLMKHAILLGHRTDNPATVVDAITTDSDGYHCWSEEEIAQYEAHWPLGTRERLAIALLLYTGLRRGDMVKLGRQHRQGDRFVLRHEKNKSDTSIRILPQLQEAIDAMQDDKHLTYLVTRKGKAFEAASFGNWFRKRCDEAGLAHCSAHGLRKAMTRRLAEGGATNLQGRAVTGHKTDAMFAHYAAAANRAKLADDAMDRVSSVISLANRDGKPTIRKARNG